MQRTLLANKLGKFDSGAPKSKGIIFKLLFRWTPQPVIVTIRNNRDYIRVLLYSYYTTITGWGVLLIYYSRTLKKCGKFYAYYRSKETTEIRFRVQGLGLRI